MADQTTIEGVAEKFERWAQGLSEEEQATLAEWLTTTSGGDVAGHTSSETWWTEPNAWSRAWTETWTTTT